MTIKTIIVDDELLGVRNLQNQLKLFCPQVEILGVRMSGNEAISLIQSLNPDLVFLDISLTDMDGFSLLSYFENPTFEVIFVTGHREFEHAVRAIEFNASSYLTKPIDSQKLVQAVNDLTSKLRQERSATPMAQPTSAEQTSATRLVPPQDDFQKIAVRTSENSRNLVLFVEVERIMYLMAKGRQTYIRLSNPSEAIIVNHSLKDFDGRLPVSAFRRVHNSYVLHRKYVSEFAAGDAIQVFVKDEKGKKDSVSISKQFLDDVKQWLKLI